MDPAATVAVGFGSAVVGAVASFLGLLHIERQRLGRTRAGIVKAVLGELQGNGACAVQVLYGARGPGRIRMRFSSEAWHAGKFELAQFAPDDTYRMILFHYQTLPMIERLSEEPKPEGPDDPVKDFVAEWEQGTKEAMIALLELPEAASFRSQWHIRLAEGNVPRPATR
jgi:hypothetical protein